MGFSSQRLSSPGVVGIAPFTQFTAVDPQDFHPLGYNLEWGDEFAGGSLDTTKWATRYHYDSGTLDHFNDEKQRFKDVDFNGNPLHVLSGSILDLRACANPDGVTFDAGMIRSKQQFRPDASKWFYITSRIFFPNGPKGSWPAFWLIPGLYQDGTGPQPPEIDILEIAMNWVNDMQWMFNCSVKSQNWGGSGNRPEGMVPPVRRHTRYDFKWCNFSNFANNSWLGQWHEMGCHWTDKTVSLFIDGLLIFTAEYEWRENNGTIAPAAHLILNYAVGGSWPTDPTNRAEWPATPASSSPRVRSDWIRVYSKTPTAQDIAARDFISNPF